MAKKSDYDIMNTAYSSIPFVRNGQNKLYLEVVDREILDIVSQANNGIKAREQLTKFLNKVYMHQKLENQKLPEDLVELADSELRRKFKSEEEFTYEPEQVLELSTEVNKYSVLPFVKKKQAMLNEDLIYKAKKILEMNGVELTKAYIQELEAAKQEGRKPHKTIVEAIDKRKAECIATSREVKNRLDGIKVFSERQSLQYNLAKANLSTLRFNIKYATEYTNNTKNREQELQAETDIVKFYDKTSGIYESNVSMLHFIKKELETLSSSERYTNGYYEFLSAQLPELEAKCAAEVNESRKKEEKRLEQLAEQEKKITQPSMEKDRMEILDENRANSNESEDERRKDPDYTQVLDHGGSISDRAGVGV
jgi:hypothetical protein